MSLSAFQVFNAFTNTALSLALDYQVSLFNAATKGGLVLTAKRNEGDFSDSTVWGRIADMVRRRDPYASGTIGVKTLTQLLETSVKVGAGTYPIQLDPAWFAWVLKNPEEGGALYGQQLAEGRLADMVNVAIGAYRAAVATQASNYYDITGSANASLGALLTTASKLGDASSRIKCWLGHSKPIYDIWGAALANTTNLFSFGTVNIMQDGFGRVFIMSDAPALTDATGVDDGDSSSGDGDAGGAVAVPSYFMAGLTDNAVVVEDNGDFNQNISNENGNNNIKRTIQSEWSYNVAVKGFAWDKAAGGKAPSTAALMTGTNWDMYVESHKDIAGVLLESR